MRELQARQQFKKRLYSIPALCVILLVTVLALRGTYVVYQKKIQSAAYVAALDTKVGTLQAQSEDISTNLANINTPEGVEKAIKQKFNVTAPGEYEAILVDPTVDASVQATTTAPWYKRAWGSIMSAL